MTDPSSAPPTGNIVARLHMLRWLLPLVLSSVAAVTESLEHTMGIHLFGSAGYLWELFLFALAGPVTVGLVLNWITGQVRARAAAEAQLQQLVEQLKQAEEEVRQANVVLEHKVAERTQSLLDAYQKVAEQNEALQALDRLKSEFVSLVSHELRAPLTSINGGLELILAFSNDLEPDVRDSLQVMSQESTRLTRLVENILNVSSLEAGQLRLNIGPVALPPLIERAVQGHLIGAPDHRFQIDIVEDLPLALADEVCLYDILYNLVDNAVKYGAGPDDGEIKVTAGYDPATGSSADGMVWISVADNGPGIEPEDQAKIFDSFHRLNGQENREVYGHGLGLYFARKLVEAQSGQIWVESKPGQGSRFTLTLPAVPPLGPGERTTDEPDDLVD
ncbi:MAG: ATP-binding protein [Anaerolineae bacterium]